MLCASNWNSSLNLIRSRRRTYRCVSCSKQFAMKKIEWHFKDTRRETNRTATDRRLQIRTATNSISPLFLSRRCSRNPLSPFPRKWQLFRCPCSAVPWDVCEERARRVLAMSSALWVKRYSRLPSAAAIYATALSMMADRQTGSVGGPWYRVMCLIGRCWSGNFAPREF